MFEGKKEARLGEYVERKRGKMYSGEKKKVR